MKLERLCCFCGLSAAALVAFSSAALAAPDSDKKADGVATPPGEMRPKAAADPHRDQGGPNPDGKRRTGESAPDQARARSSNGRDGNTGGPAASAPSGSDAPGVGTRGGLSDQGEIGKSTERRSQRLARIRELKERWGAESLKQPNVQNELRHHAWRLARLKRMRELALEKKSDKLVARVDLLEQKENLRHDRAMAREKRGVAATNAAGSAVPSGSAPPQRLAAPREPKQPHPAASARGEHGGRP